MINIEEYQRQSRETLLPDSTESDEKKERVVLLGIVGEIGSLAEVYKKKQRVRLGYSSSDDTKYRRDVQEELGDLLYYTVSLASLKGIDLKDRDISRAHQERINDERLVITELIKLCYEILSSSTDNPQTDYSEPIKNILKIIFQDIGSSKEDKDSFLQSNLKKTKLRWGNQSVKEIGNHRDREFPIHQQLPRKALIEFIKGKNGKIIMRMNGMNLGDPIDDNIENNDFYRFHDVFHWSYVTFLGWSPVLRSLLKSKRKDDPVIDRDQDGARAKIVEECISLQIFSYARENNFLEDVTYIDYSILKFIENLTQDLEVKDINYKIWEDTIKEGYEIFREMKAAFNNLDSAKNESQRIGVLHMDADERKISFEVD